MSVPGAGAASRVAARRFEDALQLVDIHAERGR
jgi:hypothetical protein